MVRGLHYLTALILSLLLLGAANAQPGRRVALIIGNSAYQHTPKLENPANDAADMTAALKKLGFEVIEGRDLDEAGMRRTIKGFATALVGADVGLFFYAGHGLQVNGQNYLVPVDAKLENAAGLDFELVRADVVHRTMERETKTNVIFLDACRNNPLSRNLARAMGTRSSQIGRGLAVVESGVGTLISFSTQPGNVAADGTGRNSPFAESLIKHMAAPKDDLSSMLINVRNDVMAATKDSQIPWEHSALRARFYFAEPPRAAASEASYSQQAELAFWGSVKDSRDPAVIQTYIDRFPQGTFAALAQVLVGKLQAEIAQAAAAAAKEAQLKQADAAQKIAADKEAETRRKAAEANQADELRKAQEEARKAREALAKAESEREVARKSAEEARKAADLAKAEREATAKAAEPAKVTSLALPKLPEPMLEPDRETLVRNIQSELKRVGCDTGAADGRWGSKARGALADFAKRSKIALAADEPTTTALEALRGQKGRVCPLLCNGDEQELNGNCVAKPRVIQQKAPTTAAEAKPVSRDTGTKCRVESYVECQTRLAAKGVPAMFQYSQCSDGSAERRQICK
jgi:uncharacterized caspase-like protein